MSSSWAKYLDTLRATKGFTNGDDVKKLLEGARKDPLGFLMVQGEMIEMYLEQLAAGELDPDEFELSVKTIHDLIDLESVKMNPEALERAKNLMQGIETHLLGSLVSKIKS
jgi:hypothetical protein